MGQPQAEAVIKNGFLIKFKVVELNFEQHSESTWILKYEEEEPFKLYEFGRTLEEDKALIGKEIEGWVEAWVEKTSIIGIHEKKISFVGNYITAIGIYEDIIETNLNGHKKLSYKLNSVFPIEISDIPQGAKLGDWIKIEGEASLGLLREIAPRWKGMKRVTT